MRQYSLFGLGLLLCIFHSSEPAAACQNWATRLVEQLHDDSSCPPSAAKPAVKKTRHVPRGPTRKTAVPAPSSQEPEWHNRSQITKVRWKTDGNVTYVFKPDGSGYFTRGDYAPKVSFRWSRSRDSFCWTVQGKPKQCGKYKLTVSGGKPTLAFDFPTQAKEAALRLSPAA